MRERRHRLAILLAVLLGQLVSPVYGKPAAPAGAPPEKPRVLQTFHAGHFDFDLTMLPCRLHECPIQVRLLAAGRVVDHLALPVPASSQRVKAEFVDQDWGADPGLKAWRSGFESEYVATVGRLLTLTPQVTGLLVSQRYGFEHVKRAHLLVLPRRGKLRVIWKAVEGEGPTWSATRVLPGATAGQDIGYFQGFFDPDGDAPGRFEAARLRWDGTTASLQETPLPDRAMPLYVLSLGDYESVAKAREARFTYASCLSSYWVLDGGAFRGMSHTRPFVGKVYPRRSQAEEAAHNAKSCLPSLTTAVQRWAAARERALGDRTSPSGVR